ncbi:ketoacyl-synt-domain-containing protein [Acrodontium crateriforme]|uniref:Ketoacyl-synt-domain-containing protein n=1 Tax=Acrodontium crateriforme TaxID=150365 RepID=A0AAQ3M1V9_9PEZI|nr:ketoacyl-synt-domain-containing protein [Acrodontium crateriforme]
MEATLALFVPQDDTGAADFQEKIRSFITEHPILRCIAEEIHTLNDVWDCLAKANPHVLTLKDGQRHAASIIDWITDGKPQDNSKVVSSAVALPQVVISHFAQYFSFLQESRLDHFEFVARARRSGAIQGYCGGIPAALAIACAEDEAHLKRLICNSIRLAYAAGVYSEFGDDLRCPGATTVLTRQRYKGQLDTLLQDYPGTYIGATDSPLNAWIVGPVEQIAAVCEHLKKLGMVAQISNIRGKTHNPENSELAQELSEICQQHSFLDLGQADRLNAPSWSTAQTYHQLMEGSLTEVFVKAVLSERCDWFDVLGTIAADLKTAGVSVVNIESFGQADCISLIPFHDHELIVRRRRHTEISRRVSGSTPSVYPSDAVAIVGAACRFPGANTLEEYWDVVSQGLDTHSELPTDRFDVGQSYRATQSHDNMAQRKFYGNFLDNVDNFDNALFNINEREALNMDPQQRMLLELAYETLESSGYLRTHDRTRGDNIGCFIGSSYLEYLENTCAHPATAYTATGTNRAFLCGRISWIFGWTGPAEVIDTACSASLVAVNRAVKAIQNGECSSALVGGVNIISGITNFIDLSKAGFLSPTGQCKPFDAQADGYCRSEGGALVFLKPLPKAQTDGDKILAVLSGASTNQGGRSFALTVPDSDSLATLYGSVLKQSQLAPKDVSYVEAHGTGTQAGDPVEIAAITKAFGGAERNKPLKIGSVKGNIGHAEVSAGIAGLVKVICMMQKGQIPPVANHKTWNPKIAPKCPSDLAIPTTLEPWQESFRAALVNSYGAAGSNAAVICCEAPQQPSNTQEVLDPRALSYPVIVSAQSERSLSAYLTRLAKYLTNTTSLPDISKVAYTLCHQRPVNRYSAVFENVRDTKELISHIKNFQRPIEVNDVPCESVLLFSGQSKQTIGLARDLYDRHSSFKQRLDGCDAILRSLGYPSIIPAVFQTQDIESVVVLQSGLVAMQYSMAMCWIEAGLNASAIVGHSLGELAALGVSGMLSIEDCLKLVARRAELIEMRCGKDTGVMLACAISRQQLQSIIDTTKIAVDIACYNGQNSQVVAGEEKDIQRLEAYMAALSIPIKCRRVRTTHAFHSRLMDPILKELDGFASDLQWSKPTLPFYFCTESGRLPAETYSPSCHARQSVYFENTIKRIEKDFGKMNWIEIGIDTPVINMAKAAVHTVDGHAFHQTSAKSRDGSPTEDVLAQTISSLWRAGINVSYWQFMTISNTRGATWLPPYEFDSKKFWVEHIDHAAVLEVQKGSSPSENSPSASHTQLIRPLSNTHSQANEWRFEISPNSERFGAIVSGHAVRGRPLCPASLYMECISMAIGSLIGVPVPHLEFSKIEMQAPLGLDSSCAEILLTQSHQNTWNFSVTSNGSKKNVHSQGIARIDAQGAANLAVASRLAQRRLSDLQMTSAEEKLRNTRAYALFDRVVSYKDFMRGISAIDLYDSEALATVTLQPNQPCRAESTALSTCDSVPLDTFIQVLGLLVNTSNLVGSNEVFICSAIGQSNTSDTCDLLKEVSWTVYASYTSINASTISGDVFAFAPSHSLSAVFIDCRFTKVDMTRLERALDATSNCIAANEVESVSQASRSTGCPQDAEQTWERGRTTGLSSDSPPSVSLATPKSPSLGDEDHLIPLLKRYTSGKLNVIADNLHLSDIGLDSLATVELAEDIKSSWEVQLDASELLWMKVGELREILSAGNAHNSRSSKQQ